MRCCLLLLRLFLLLNIECVIFIRCRYQNDVLSAFFSIMFVVSPWALYEKYLLLLVLSFLSLLFLLRLPGYTTLFLLFRTRLLRFRCSIFVLCLPPFTVFSYSRSCSIIYVRCRLTFSVITLHLILQVISVISCCVFIFCM